MIKKIKQLFCEHRYGYGVFLPDEPHRNVYGRCSKCSKELPYDSSFHNRTNPEWDGKLMVSGKMIKNETNRQDK